MSQKGISLLLISSIMSWSPENCPNAKQIRKYHLAVEMIEMICIHYIKEFFGIESTGRNSKYRSTLGMSANGITIYIGKSSNSFQTDNTWNGYIPGPGTQNGSILTLVYIINYSFVSWWNVIFMGKSYHSWAYAENEQWALNILMAFDVQCS